MNFFLIYFLKFCCIISKISGAGRKVVLACSRRVAITQKWIKPQWIGWAWGFVPQLPPWRRRQQRYGEEQGWGTCQRCPKWWQKLAGWARAANLLASCASSWASLINLVPKSRWSSPSSSSSTISRFLILIPILFFLIIIVFRLLFRYGVPAHQLFEECSHSHISQSIQHYCSPICFYSKWVIGFAICFVNCDVELCNSV